MSSITTLVRARITPTQRRVGFALGLALASLVYFAMPDIEPSPEALAIGLDNPRAGAVTLALIVLMAVWWMLEVVPLAVTGLLPVVIIPASGINTVGAVTASYGNKVVFLFLGGFVLSLAMQRWNLHRHIALRVVMLFGTRPKQLVFGFMFATMLLGMWISNTATAILMMSIGHSMIRLLKKHGVNDPNLNRSMLVGIAYSASISAFGTIIASPPNALLVGYLEESYGFTVGFGQWMLVGVPLSLVFLTICWFVLTHIVFRSSLHDLPGGRDIIRKELDALGPLNAGQRRVLYIFAAVIFGWVILPMIWPTSPITDEVVSIAAAISFFLVPAAGPASGSLLTWNDMRDLQWGILILFGGGLALAAEISSSGLSDWLASQLGGLAGLPTVALVVAVCAATMILTEFMSNTASASTLIPIAAALAVSVGMAPIALALPVTFASTCAFLMPASTPPNAVAVGSGMVKPKQLLKAGWMMTLSGLILIPLVSVTLAPIVFGF